MSTNRRTLLFAPLLAAFLPLFGSCAAEDPNGTLTLRNESVTNRSYEILVNGARIGSIAAGDSMSHKLAPGQYVVVFMFANTSNAACSPAVATISKGQEEIFTCRS